MLFSYILYVNGGFKAQWEAADLLNLLPRNQLLSWGGSEWLSILFYGQWMKPDEILQTGVHGKSVQRHSQDECQSLDAAINLHKKQRFQVLLLGTKEFLITPEVHPETCSRITK